MVLEAEVQGQRLGRAGSFWGWEGEAVLASPRADEGLLATLVFLGL